MPADTEREHFFRGRGGEKWKKWKIMENNGKKWKKMKFI